MVAGFAFKVSAFPFQFWAPDTYEGAPVPVAAYLSVASKAAGFAGLLQLMFVAFLPLADFWAPIFAHPVRVHDVRGEPGGAAAAAGGPAARVLVHRAGRLHAAAVRAGRALRERGQAAFAAVVLYILIYAVTNLGAFAVVIGMSRDAPTLLISDFAGLGQRAAAARRRHGRRA